MSVIQIVGYADFKNSSSYLPIAAVTWLKIAYFFIKTVFFSENWNPKWDYD